jgi:hypothetical protein
VWKTDNLTSICETIKEWCLLGCVALVRTDVSKELSAPFIRVTRIGEIGTTLAATSNRRTLRVFLCSVRRLLVTANVVPSSPNLVTMMKEALGSSETSILTRSTGCNIPEGTILHLLVGLQSKFRFHVQERIASQLHGYFGNISSRYWYIA